MAKATILKRSLLIIASALLLVNIFFCGITYARYSDTTELFATLKVGGMGCYVDSPYFIAKTEGSELTGQYNFNLANYSGNSIGGTNYSTTVVFSYSGFWYTWNLPPYLVAYKFTGNTLAELNANIANNTYTTINYSSSISNTTFTFTSGNVIQGDEFEYYAFHLNIPSIKKNSWIDPWISVQIVTSQES